MTKFQTASFLPFLFLLFTFLYSPVMAATPLDDAQTLAKGLENWKKAKQQCNGTYAYTVSFVSAFGFGHNTEITVQDNQVVQRKYTEFSDRLAASGKESGWTESPADLGSHNQGAALKTLDQLYAEAEKIVAQPLQPNQRRYVKLDKQGLLTSCFYMDNRIADDAAQVGFNLSLIGLSAVLPIGRSDEVDDVPDPEAVKNLKPFPPAQEGMRRFVILLPHKGRGAEDDFRIEITVGKKMMTDGVNLMKLGGAIEKKDLKGWGFSFFEVNAFGPGMSTLIGVPPGAPQVETFVSLQPMIQRYNSRLPIVVYAPSDGEVRYRIFSAGKTKTAEQR